MNLIQCSQKKPKIVKIEEDYIHVDILAEEINPFDMLTYGHNPFLEFASIDVNNLFEIENYVSKYGLLGISKEAADVAAKNISDVIDNFLEREYEKVLDNTVDAAQMTPESLISFIGKDVFPFADSALYLKAEGMKYERLEEFIHEVKVMACLIKLYDSKKYLETEACINELRELLPHGINDIRNIEDQAFKCNIREALNINIVSFFITERMRSVGFNTDLLYDLKLKTYKLRAKYIVPTLIAGLYTIFYFHIIDNERIQQCPICKRFYATANTACSIKCINTLSSRKYREKIANNTIILEYEKERKKMSARTTLPGSKRITKEEFEKWKKAATQMRDAAKSVEEFRELLNKKSKEV